MEDKKLIEQYPTIYHMAETGSWPLILKYGLLCTSGLLDLLECTSQQREQIESRRRPEKVFLKHPTMGSVVIRDQKPIRDQALKKVLIGCEPEDWYQILNSQVFFWPTLDRLLSLLNARPYRDSPQIVIAVNTEKLLAGYHENIRLSPINSGATLYNPVARGPTTFLGIADYPYDYWRKKRSSSKAVAEIAIIGGIKNITQYAVEVREWRGARPGELIWASESS